MTIEARYNLQRGLPENKRFKGTTYHVENLLDAYIFQKNLMKDKFLDQQQLTELLEVELQECLDQALENILKPFS